MYLKDISKNAPAESSSTEGAFTKAVTLYCSAKLESRYKKLKDYINKNGDSEHVKSFKDFFFTNIDHADRTNMLMASCACNRYYKEVKDKNDDKDGEDKSSIPSEFLERIKKVGSYVGFMIGIVECARNIQYRLLFSNSTVIRRNPVTFDNQPIYLWKNIIRRFIDEDKYKGFMDKCLKKTNVMERIRRVYTDNTTKQQQLLDGGDVKQSIYLHVEMNILAYIINYKINGRVFIAVSKKWCYKKIYSEWKLPHVKDDNFKIKFLRYILENLDRIIEQKLEHYTRSLRADSDSGGNVSDPSNSGVEYMDIHFKKAIKNLKRATPLFE